MKQEKISRWLKCITIVLGIIGLLFFGAVTVFALYLKNKTNSGLMWTFVLFTWYTAILCYGVLVQFWEVCTEIGNDNSFSLENATSFHTMGLLGIASGVGYVVRVIWLTIVGAINLGTFIYSIGLLLLSIVFFGLCEALSQLVRNAYEVKQENELTI